MVEVNSALMCFNVLFLQIPALLGEGEVLGRVKAEGKEIENRKVRDVLKCHSSTF